MEVFQSFLQIFPLSTEIIRGTEKEFKMLRIFVITLYLLLVLNKILNDLRKSTDDGYSMQHILNY